MASGKNKEVEVKKSTEALKETPTRAPSPFEEMDHFASHLFPRSWLKHFRTDWPSWHEMAPVFEGKMPRVDVIERDDEMVIHAEVPGVNKEDLDISVTDNSVTISGSTHHEEKEEKGDYYRSEISRGSFSRIVALPGDVDSDKAKASYQDGVLELTIPKVEKSKRKKVTIS